MTPRDRDWADEHDGVTEVAFDLPGWPPAKTARILAKVSSERLGDYNCYLRMERMTPVLRCHARTIEWG
jgi:hypothetical protein